MPLEQRLIDFSFKVQVINGFKFSGIRFLFNSILLQSCTKDLQTVPSGQTSRHGWSSLKLPFCKQLVGNIWHTLQPSNPDIITTCRSITDRLKTTHLFTLGHQLMEHATFPQVIITKSKQTLFQLTIYCLLLLTQHTQ